MLAAGKVCDAKPLCMRYCQRQQQQRLARAVARDHDERPDALACADMALSSRGRILANAGLRLAWVSGVARLMGRRRGGAGAILRFEHVRPGRTTAFQPRRAHEITPQFLDRAIAALKRGKLDIVSMD